MNLFLRITPYYVRYLLAEKRPYFELDALLLRAIDEGLDSVEELECAFALPRTVLMHALVGLFDDGWLAIPRTSRRLAGAAPYQTFVLTGRAEEWLRSAVGQLPAAARIEHDNRLVLREQFTGSLCLASRASRRFTRDELSREGLARNGHFLPNSIDNTPLDESRLRPVLPVPPGRSYCGVESIEIRRHPEFLVLPYDPETGSLANIPSMWRQRVVPQILEFLRGKNLLRASPLIQPELDWTAVSKQNVSYRNVASDIRTVAIERMDQAGFSVHIAIVLQQPSQQALDVLTEPLRLALQNGANVDFIWGQPAGGATHVRNWLKRMKEATNGQDGRIRSPGEPLAIGSDLLLETSFRPAIRLVSGRFMIGSREWLSQSLANSPDNGTAAVEIEDHFLAEQMCRQLAHFLSAGGGRESELAAFWRNRAAEISINRPDPSKNNEDAVKVHLALDAPGQEQIVRYAISAPAEFRRLNLSALSEECRSRVAQFATEAGEAPMENADTPQQLLLTDKMVLFVPLHRMLDGDSWSPRLREFLIGCAVEGLTP